jgi:hypothetical protein
MVRVTVYSPDSLYVCSSTRLELVSPSPKSQCTAIDSLSGSYEPLASNVNVLQRGVVNGCMEIDVGLTDLFTVWAWIVSGIKRKKVIRIKQNNKIFLKSISCPFLQRYLIFIQRNENLKIL